MIRGLTICGRAALARPRHPWLICEDWAWAFYRMFTLKVGRFT